MAIASQPVTLPPLTYEAYMAEGEIDRRYDIIDGVRHFMPSPRWQHQRISDNLTQLLRRYEKVAGNGMFVSAPFDVLIRRNPLRTCQPDGLYISNERLQQGGGVPDEGPLEVAPELAIEILSPSETSQSLMDKIEEYRMIGVLECWIVNPDDLTVEVRRLSTIAAETVAIYGHQDTIRSLVFADLILAVSEIFSA